MPLSKQFRSPHTPSPIYGIRPGFSIADFDRQYTPALRVFGSLGNEPPINAVSSNTTSQSIPAAARAVRISVQVSGNGSGSVDLTVKSAVDSFTATVIKYTGIGEGTHEFYLGGWASPTSNNDAAYHATQYGPVPPNSQATTGLSKDTDNNYVGGPYNPVDFLSLDGYDLQFTTDNFSGSAVVTVDVYPMS